MATGRTWNLLSVPIDSVGRRPGGTELAPEALLAAGLEDAVRLGRRAATLTLLRNPQRDPHSGVVAFDQVLDLSRGWLEAAGDHGLDPQDLAILGYRDLDEARELGSLLPANLPGGTFVDTPAVRRFGPATVSAEVAARLAAAGSGDGYWVHIDLDVLDESVFPATDAFVDGGLDWEELEDLVSPLLASDSCLGLDLVCFNPEKDPDGESARRIVELLGAVG